MRNYAINNIMSHNDEICYICSIEQNLLWVTNQYGTSSVGKKRYILDDIELSDWFFNQLFDDKRSVDTWIMATSKDAPGNPIFWIRKEVEGVYHFQEITNGKTFCFVIDSVREFQNLYNFYREYYEWAECLVDIDGRIKEIFKVV